MMLLEMMNEEEMIGNEEGSFEIAELSGMEDEGTGIDKEAPEIEEETIGIDEEPAGSEELIGMDSDPGIMAELIGIDSELGRMSELIATEELIEGAMIIEEDPIWAKEELKGIDEGRTGPDDDPRAAEENENDMMDDIGIEGILAEMEPEIPAEFEAEIPNEIVPEIAGLEDFVGIEERSVPQV